VSATDAGAGAVPLAPRRTGRLTWRLFALVGAVVLAALLLSLTILSLIASRTARVASDQALDRAAHLVTMLLDGREQSLSRASAVFVQNPIFRSLVLADSAGDLRDQSSEAAERTGATWVQIVNARGERLARSDDMAAPRVSLAGSALIARALGGDAATGFGTAADTMLLQVVAVPIAMPSASGEQAVGALMAAQRIDSVLAGRVKDATATDVIFYVLDSADAPHVAASTLGRAPDVQTLVQRATARRGSANDSVARFAVTLADADYLGRAVALRSAGGDQLGGFLALRSRAVEVAPFTLLRRWMLLTGLLSLAVGAGVAYVLARSISDPVLALADAARRAADGDYAATVPSDARDEVGQLAGAMRTMLSDLREKHALVELLQSSTPVRGTAAQGTEAVAIDVGGVVAGRYEIRAVLGTGGAGIVYKAFDRELQEVVALKTLHADAVAQDPGAIERLKSEIRLARRIAHRGVVRTYDLGEDGGTYFLTMEYVSGTALSELLERDGRLPASAVYSIARQLARALSVAHEQGIIHRDIKPQNIMLQADGTLKIMDFGIARLAVRTTALTQVGMAVGTPGYMAPEQLMDADVDARADLYACGVVLYECLTGQLPHDASNPVLLIGRVLAGTPVPTPIELAADTPPRLSEIVMRLLAADPADRTASAEVLYAQLTAAEADRAMV
jgi:eukaryotic-like serine/threonine-protein kinase